VPLVKTAALLAECLADELHLMVAPFFVGGSDASPWT
jgi:riboflavin biosynthesis pyrimidine reductase